MLLNFTKLKSKYSMKINAIIHVGAHYGEELAQYEKNEIKKVFAFEPLEVNLKILRQNASKLNSEIIIYPYGIGDKNEIQEMFISSNNAESSSFLKPKDHLIHHPDINFKKGPRVSIRKLDDFNLDANFLNIDVQGYELQVLLGASRTLNKVDYIYIEVNRSETYENNALINDIDEYLAKYKFLRVETSFANKNISWGDALYIKNYKINFLRDFFKIFKLKKLKKKFKIY